MLSINVSKRICWDRWHIGITSYIYIYMYICTTRWTNVKPLTDKITVFLKWVQHLHFSCDMALMWSHFLKLIQKTVEAWAHSHPSSVKCSVKLEATHGWQQSFFLSLWSFQAGSMLSAKGGGFQGCIIFVTTLQIPHSSATWWVASETGCRSCPAVGSVSEDRVGHFGAVVMVTAALTKHWLQEQQSCNCSWQILGRCVTWLWLSCVTGDTQLHKKT